MAEFPALPVFTDAFIADTTHLSPEEVGVYWLLIMCAWRSPGCRLPKDDGRIARMARVSPAKWKKLKPIILSFWTEKDDFFYQKKLSKIYEEVAEKVSKNRENGKRGGRPKSLNNNEPPKANGYSGENQTVNPNHNPNHNPNETQTEPNQNHNQSKKEKDTSYQKRKGSRLSEDWRPDDVQRQLIMRDRQVTSEYVDHQLEKFRNYWIAKTGKDATKLDWPRTFDNWIINDLDRNPRPQGQGAFQV